MAAFAHRSVMLAEVIDLLAPRAGGVYVDATLGEGGHAEAMLEASAPDGRVTGFDRDPSAIVAASNRLARFGDRFRAVHAPFGDLDQHVSGPVDGVLFDLGVRSPQIDDGSRGFSFQHEGPVDMRMDPGQALDAAGLIESLDEAALADILFRYGEEPRARAIASALRAGRPWTSTLALAEAVARASGYHGGRTHPATKTFQALRIAVNDELGELERGLEAALRVLTPGGRLVVISFHSLEDRIVKHRFRKAAGVDAPRDGYGHPLTPPVARLVAPGGLDGRTHDPSNARARSARVRCVEILSPNPSARNAGGPLQP